ncbi:uncharacterized protein LOC126678997 [Mercurialis annua]|uniref:uncharacterized protein LOC126678997 n=1 Tax=Mercurialis annua TaxID=3986 RepID=UPI00215F4A78|nr:uncharacterized protein LOC126678997 [Mercurialis annua]
MRGISVLLPVKYNFRQLLYPVTRSWGTMATVTPRKQENEYKGGRGLNEKTDPIVAFSRPPPLPPVVGPLLALSFFETWSSREGGDDE